ncbi:MULTISPECIES: TonB-dependent receptor [unclassified Novosphingobium]|uniref:TonB-dependent receptor n=1 Tax=unclassified Novosphingobium TaxID=2644732 RepID=UPI001358729E|nr:MULTISPECIES: TonB-dependent receptor [unclassified Novosphingobium]
MQKASLKALALAGSALAQLACITAVHAQQAPVADEQQGLQEIVVTAQKRAENLQSVPISVTAVGSATLENLQATSLQALQGSVPNIQINNFSNTPNTAVYTIRGIGVVEPDPYAGNTVSIVVDGVPQFFSMGALLDIYDVDRIEILRGPQGTLFGANTTGGVVNVINGQPEMGKFSGRVEGAYGNYNRFDAKATVNIPLNEDSLAARISVLHTQREGFVTNVVDGSDMGKRNITGVRGKLRAKSGNLDAVLAAEYVRARNGAPVVVSGTLPGEATYVAPGVAGMYQQPCAVAGQPCKAPDKYYSANDSVPDKSDMDTFSTSLTLNLSDTPLGDLTAITGYRHFKLREFTDQDGTPLFLDDTRRKTTGWQLSQELRSNIQVTDAIRVLVGGFYLKTHYDHSQNFRIQFAAPGLLQINMQDQDNHSLSAFAQAYADLTDKLRLQAGIRYTYERTHMIADTQNSISLSGMTDFDGTGNVALGGFTADRSKSWNNLGWKVGLDYQLADSTLLYGYWARGFKSGGFVGRISLPQDVGPYGPEHVDTFEAGFKADFLDRRLRTNLAVFYTNYRDIQIAQTYFTKDALGNDVNSTTIQNAAKATIKGFELELTALPANGLTLTGSVAYLDATYKTFDFLNGGTGQIEDLSGYRLQNAPKWTATAGINYAFNVAGGQAHANAGYSYTAAKFLNAINDTARSHIQPTHLVNASLDWSPAGSGLTIGAYANNLLDKRYLASVFDAPGTIGLVNYASPREYGVTARFEW